MIASFTAWWKAKTDKFWLWLYTLSCRHVPEGYMDATWTEFLSERIEALGKSHSQEFVTWVLSDLFATEDGQGRDYRPEDREVRDIR